MSAPPPSSPGRHTLAARLRSGPLSVPGAPQIFRPLLATIEPAATRAPSHGIINTGAAILRALWGPGRRVPFWPAVAVVLLAAGMIATVALCKPLGLCWERPAAAAPTRAR